jgi:hypothetical protein
MAVPPRSEREKIEYVAYDPGSVSWFTHQRRRGAARAADPLPRGHRSHETVRQWARKFGRRSANQTRRPTPRVGDKWHPDESVLKITGVEA